MNNIIITIVFSTEQKKEKQTKAKTPVKDENILDTFRRRPIIIRLRISIM
jgi:hypothetical protein